MRLSTGASRLWVRENKLRLSGSVFWLTEHWIIGNSSEGCCRATRWLSGVCRGSNGRGGIAATNPLKVTPSPHPGPFPVHLSA
jgi:hypothetical protein